MADKYKNSWMHPRSKQWHLIDHVIVRQRDIRDVLITRAMRGAECWTDHSRLIRSTLYLVVAPHHPRRQKLSRRTFNIAKLPQFQCLDAFQHKLDEKLAIIGQLSSDPSWK